MALTLTLPLPAPIAVGRVVTIAPEPDGGAVGIRDLATGIVYRVAVAPEAFGALPWRGRVDACTVVADDGAPRTVLELGAVPVPGSGATSGSAVALSGAEQAAASAGAEAALWGGTDRPVREEPERFW